VTIGQRRKKLEEMARGNGLSDAYTTTLTRLRAQKGNKSGLGLKVLMWVLYSERPLRAEELCHALGVEIGSVDLDPINVPVLRALLSSCLGLVTVEASSSTVQLVHFTLQEHLLSDPTLFHNPHSVIAEVCLTYLNFRSVWDLSPTLRSAPSTMPLLEYASCYWGMHTRMGMTENVMMLGLRLLDRFDEHISGQLLLLHSKQDSFLDPGFDGAGGPVGFTGLHGASFLGIAKIVAAILEMKKWDVNASDCMGFTAIALAAGGGYEEVVKILLERRDINSNKPENRGQTPLYCAAWAGYEGVVKMLLERKDVNPDKPDNRGQTPLSGASWNGHEKVVKILLEHDEVNPEKPDVYGQTPLFGAASNGHERVVEVLLGRDDVNPDNPNKYGQTPLFGAAWDGHEGVVKILLGHDDVNPDKPDKLGRTSLWWAAKSGHIGVVALLQPLASTTSSAP